MSMSIKRWHWGKIVILWAWGSLVVVLLITSFLSKKVTEAPIASSFSSIGSVLILGALTVVTWIWLSGKEEVQAERR